MWRGGENCFRQRKQHVPRPPGRRDLGEFKEQED